MDNRDFVVLNQFFDAKFAVSPRGKPTPTPGGTTDYNELDNKPSIEGVTLQGDKTLEELGIQNCQELEVWEFEELLYSD